MKRIFFIAMFLVALSVSAQKTSFSAMAKAEYMTALDGKEVTFDDILAQYKGKVVLIDVWASWCSDCIKGMPDVKKLQSQFSNDKTVFLFLSLDRALDSWKNGIKKYDVQGEHYYISKGWKGSEFCKDIELDWIPRYMIIDKEGKIVYFKAIKANDEQLINYLKSLQ